MKSLVKAKGIFDGTGGPLIENGFMLIDGGRIEKVGVYQDDLFDEESFDIVDFSNHYITPGFIDAHTHLSIVPGEGNQLAQMKLPPERNVLRSIPNLEKSFSSGVTTMRIMGEEHFFDIEMKNGIDQGMISAPRLLVSGKGLVASNGHGVALTTTDGVEEVRKHARINFSRGADFLKLFVTGGISSAGTKVDACTYSREEIAMAVEEAERVGSYAAAHAHGGRGLDLCIEEGVRTIEHAAFITEKQVEKLMEKNLWIIGTFSILFHPSGIEKTDFSIPAIRDKLLRARETEEKTFQMVLNYQPNLALGTDSMHGLISYEAECLVRFGASTEQALSAITINAAKACRIEDRLGTLEAGKMADFVVFNNNPLEDIKHIRQPLFVYKEGKPGFRSDGGVH